MIKKVLLVLTMLSLVKVAFSATPQELLKGYEAQSGKASSAHGEQFFNAKHGTGKLIKPLSPNSFPERFTDQAKVEKWFKRNCNDVLSRECSAQEKADLLSWLMTVK